MLTGGRDTIFDYFPVTIYQRTVNAFRSLNTFLICALDQTCVDNYITTEVKPVIYEQWLLAKNVFIMASMVLDVFLVIATAKRPMEEYRFAREMLGLGWHWNLLELAGLATGVNFASLVGVTFLQMISFVKY